MALRCVAVFTSAYNLSSPPTSGEVAFLKTVLFACACNPSPDLCRRLTLECPKAEYDERAMEPDPRAINAPIECRKSAEGPR